MPPTVELMIDALHAARERTGATTIVITHDTYVAHALTSKTVVLETSGIHPQTVTVISEKPSSHHAPPSTVNALTTATTSDEASSSVTPTIAINPPEKPNLSRVQLSPS